MASALPAINVVEKNLYAPRPFVFSEVAICLRESILAAGHTCEILHNRIDPHGYSIVLGAFPDNAHELEHLDPARCAIFNFEQLGSTSPIAGPPYRQWLSNWMVLDYHDTNIAFLKRENGSRQIAFELPLVPTASLCTEGAETKDIDVLFYGTMTERRTRVLEQLRAMGFKAEGVAGAYGTELAPAIRRAKMVLHVHYYDTGLFPIARVAQPVMMGVPIVCETSVFSDLNDWSESGIIFTGYEHLAQTCAEFLEAPERMAVRARMVRSFVRGIDFATPFAAVVRALESRAAGGTAASTGGEELLSEVEITRILEEEGAALAPESHAPVPPVSIVQREPGKGPHGKWIVALLILFSIYTIWMSMRF
jgi:hypothetical protein